MARQPRLADRARKAARNIGVSDRERRAAADQSIFGALVEQRGIPVREIARKHGLSVPMLYRYMRGIWNKPHPRTQDRFVTWFWTEFRRRLSPPAQEHMVRSMVRSGASAEKKLELTQAFLAKWCPQTVDPSPVTEEVLK